ncbi:ABC transporter ATP-binding protein [Adlercreutzia murintestinalis]|uniref:ABC transporter ATP-binding protein n=1 Tax=Adlercreutzia murintestinalis TaxID=2941325 RepID=UPI00203B398E|nr:ATP-binding cassette domain-containing protein [Adlercreutzia murintestinalis]
MAGSIDIRDLEVHRGAFTLRVPELHVVPHEMFAILGATGSGKTVLLETIAGAYPHAAGEILLGGRPEDELPIQERQLGILYQDYALFPHMSVRENVSYGLKVRRVPEEELHERTNELLDSFGIGDIADRYPGIISGGEAQRAALARALILRPEVLLLDEPFSALDPATKKRMYAVLRNVHERFGCTIVFVTHDFQEASALADRVAILLDGSLRVVRESQHLFCEEGLDEDVKAFLDISPAPVEVTSKYRIQ